MPYGYIIALKFILLWFFGDDKMRIMAEIKALKDYITEELKKK